MTEETEFKPQLLRQIPEHVGMSEQSIFRMLEAHDVPAGYSMWNSWINKSVNMKFSHLVVICNLFQIDLDSFFGPKGDDNCRLVFIDSKIWKSFKFDYVDFADDFLKSFGNQKKQVLLHSSITGHYYTKIRKHNVDSFSVEMMLLMEAEGSLSFSDYKRTRVAASSSPNMVSEDLYVSEKYKDPIAVAELQKRCDELQRQLEVASRSLDKANTQLSIYEEQCNDNVSTIKQQEYIIKQQAATINQLREELKKKL